MSEAALYCHLISLPLEAVMPSYLGWSQQRSTLLVVFLFDPEAEQTGTPSVVDQSASSEEVLYKHFSLNCRLASRLWVPPRDIGMALG